jgi:glyoxylase-like metal-dependent hydrolase (beta-lactamase superfamily II)
MRVELGGKTLQVLSDGRFALDGGALFGVVPRTLWERHDPPDEKNRVSLALNVALIEAAGKRILVDTGIGDKWSEKQRAIYRIDRTETLFSSLKRLSLGPEDIDFVINTHLHFDHSGGNTRIEGGKPVPAFPRARYIVQLGECEDATCPNERNRASYIEADYVPLAEHKQLETVQGDAEIVPGVRVEVIGGHTAYFQMVVVEGREKTLVIPADVLPTTSHVPLPSIMSYDLFPLGTLEAKRRLLRDAATADWSVLFYHDLRLPLGHVLEEGGRYRAEPT